ncbi:prolyl 3-hydroxylase OGFOD1 [Chelonus insularis]|uniref:prolyl 3-hydroxylase OGFOD1 n=1 Tax=Chelonus insularis TaxID=460826 RepID=UPI00158F4C0C|nr:prolyl 3-hydroxylase OGFOD1 [Chelonus insularis]XP_034950367.1 prolyl 3-hydroxylase OGFOD1 [Chelonus insularis]
MAEGVPKLKKFKHSILSDHVESQEFQEIFRKHWLNQMSIKTKNLEIIVEPFRVCKISNFIRSESFMDDLKSELSEVQSKRLTMDLYQFEQTNDLANYCTDNIGIFHETFKTTMVTWMENNTNIELSSTISMTGSCYCDTDYLLCHDDNMGDRRIAFILYLMPTWSAKDGGTLDLFDTDDKGLPKNVVRSIVPEYNSLVFFEVSDHSYHQVAEVTSPELSRWSINGWFHGPQRECRPPHPQIECQLLDPIDKEEDLSYWIMDTYLTAGIVEGIQNDVEKKSYTYLGHFLKPKMYEKLSQEIVAESIKWKRVGPANLRNYEVAEASSLPCTLKRFYDMFGTISFFRLLKNYTQLDLVPDNKNMKPQMSIELQRWSKGCYTLICDKLSEEESSGIVDEDNADDEKSNINSSRGSIEEEKLQKRCIGLSLSDGSGGKKVDKILETNDDWNRDPFEDDKVLRSILKDKKPKVDKQDESEEASCSKSEDYSKRSPPLHPDSEDPEVSDIGDYLSDSLSEDDQDEEEEQDVPGTLDVIMQFNTNDVPESETIDYIDTKELDSALIHIAPDDNHLSLVYKQLSTCRLHKYVNHYCEGYFYNLICTYRE